MKALNPRLTHEYVRGWMLCFEIDSEYQEQAKTIVDEYHDGYVEVIVEKWSDKRSLQANAYFHVLANKIAAATNSSLDDVKKMLVERYGTLARSADNKCMAAKLPKNTNIDLIYPYYRYIGDDETGLAMYLFYKRTRDLNKEEMSRLIEGTVSEAKALNIETLTPDELARMMNRYKEGV